MNTIKCKYDWDDGTVELLFSDGTTQNTLYKQYKERYPDMSDEQIMSLVRECQMYGEIEKTEEYITITTKSSKYIFKI